MRRLFKRLLVSFLLFFSFQITMVQRKQNFKGFKETSIFRRIMSFLNQVSGTLSTGHFRCSCSARVSFICLWQFLPRLFREMEKEKKQAIRMRQRKSNEKKRRKKEKGKEEKKKDTKNVKWFNNETTSLSGQCIYNLHAYWFHCRTLCAPPMKYILPFGAFFFLLIWREIPFWCWDRLLTTNWKMLRAVIGFLLWITSCVNLPYRKSTQGTMMDRLWRHREG